MADSIHSARVKKCAELMTKHDLDVLLLTKPSNMFYLTGDGRLCSYAMITSRGDVALGVPSTDIEDVAKTAVFDKIVGFEDEVGMIHSIAHYFKEFGISKGSMGIENTFLTMSMQGMLTHPHAKPEQVAAKDATHLLSQLRLVKEAAEIELMKEAARVADIGMQAAIDAVAAGVTESEVAGAAEYAMRRHGAEGFWRSYVAAGPRTNIAHGLPSNRRIESGDLVMIDIHPIVNNYSADLCRMVCAGTPSTIQQEVYDLYLQGLLAAIAKCSNGVGMVELENAMHDIYKAAGHKDHIFGPAIHGTGIDFEEAPLPPGHAFFHGEKAPDPLQTNTVIAVGNCGLYCGSWGIRIEDTVAVGAAEPVVLTNYPRELVRK
jgi:Xaa-Pro aminopeptidase